MSKFNAGDPVFVTDPDGNRVRAIVRDTLSDGRIEVVAENGWWLARHSAQIEARKPDIPRERVEALHAAVTARLEQLEASRAATWYASEKDIFAACHSDLSEVAESLRLLLEVDP